MDDGKGDRSRERFRGCLLGGAVGDALGAPVEFLDLAELRRRHGGAGVTGLVAGDWPAGTITDDTQLSLFTAEALIRSQRRRDREELVSIPGAARRAYLRWLHTQGEHVAHETMDGWLARLELRDVVTQVADDLWAHFGDGRPDHNDDEDRYPPA